MKTVNLELSKELDKLLGDKKPESYFKWRSDGAEVIPTHELREDYQKEFPSAYTLSELFDQMPDGVILEKAPNGYFAELEGEELRTDPSPEDCMAKMKIYLIENEI